MFLLLRIKVMNWIKLIYSLVGVFSLQFILADFLSIDGIRPDFVLIYILYIGLHHGSFPSVIVGFFLGLLVDFTSKNIWWVIRFAHISQYFSCFGIR